MKITIISIALFFISSFVAYSQEVPGSSTCTILNTTRISEKDYTLDLEIKYDNATSISVNVIDLEAGYKMTVTPNDLKSGVLEFTTFYLMYGNRIHIEITASNANGKKITRYVIPPVYDNGGVPFITDIAPAIPKVEILERGVMTDNVDSYVRFKVTSAGAEQFTMAVNSVDLSGNTGPRISVTKTPGESENYLAITAIPFSDKISDAQIIFTALNDFGEAVSEAISMKAILTVSAVDNTKEKAIGIYPNPVRNILNIQGIGQSLRSICILDLSGRIVKQFTTLNSQRIEVSDLQSGVYFIEMVYDNTTKSTYKIVKE